MKKIIIKDILAQGNINQNVTGIDIKRVLDAILNGTKINTSQKPSLGCNIKWK